MDEDKSKKLIGAMILTILTGSLDVRIQFTGIAISNLEIWITNEKVLKDMVAIEKIRKHLTDAFIRIVLADEIVKRRGDTRRKNREGRQIREMREHFKQSCLVLDASYDNPHSVMIAQTVKEITGLRLAREHFQNAIHAFGFCLAGNPDGFTAASTQVDMAIKILLEICCDNNLVDITEKEFMKSITSRPAPPQPEPSKR